MTAYRFDYHPSSDLPALAWIAWIGDGVVDVVCGESVKRQDDAFFEGTWAGPPMLSALPDLTTVFGSGIVARGDDLIVVTPAHAYEGIWFVRHSGTVVVANTLVGLMAGAGLELDPKEAYPHRFLRVADLKWMHEDPTTGLVAEPIVSLPTRTETVSGLFYENLRIDSGGNTHISRKPREVPFKSFVDYRDRLAAATASAFANAGGYEPVVALSGGYDSTAVAAVAAQLGCRRAVSLDSARLFPSGESTGDDGRAVASALGLQIEVFDRLSYREREDLPEAEFMAGGMSGEDVVMSAFEPSIGRTLLLTGYWTGAVWVKSKLYPPPGLHPGDLSGADLTEFRLRADFVHIPLPTFGSAQPDDFDHFYDDADMQPYMLGGHYDRPIPRRLAEEAGVPRGAFATRKRAASVMIQRDPAAWLAPATTAAIKRFAGSDGRVVHFRRRSPTPRLHRALIRTANRLRVPWLARGLEERRRSLVQFEPELGTLLLRWAMSVDQAALQDGSGSSRDKSYRLLTAAPRRCLDSAPIEYVTGSEREE